MVEQVECRRRDAGEERRAQWDTHMHANSRRSDSQGKLLPQAPPILLLWFHGVEEGKLDDVWPDGGAGAPADPAEGHKRDGLSRKDMHGLICVAVAYARPT